MNQHIKIIVLFLVALSMNCVCFAQQKERKPTKSVIVMKKAQLDSLLAGIAKRKKAQLAKRKQLSGMSASQKPEKRRMASSYNTQKTHHPVPNESMILQTMNSLNQKMNQLRMEIRKISPQTNNNYPRGSGMTIIPDAGRPPTIFYQEGRPVVPNSPRYSGNSSARVSDNLNYEITNLQDKIEDLQTKINYLEKNPNSVNKRKIADLKGRVDTLNTQLGEANRINQSVKQYEINGNNSIITVLKNYRQKIYFANNSTNLNSADKALLLQLTQMIKRTSKHPTVLVQGYASKTGSALYNYKLSLKRANAVKDVLTGYGIRADKIETLGHGVDMSNNMQEARMVEISLITD